MFIVIITLTLLCLALLLFHLVLYPWLLKSLIAKRRRQLATIPRPGALCGRHDKRYRHFS